MKYSISLLIVLLIALAGTAFAQHEPPGGWPVCNGCLYAAHWQGDSNPVWDTCKYSACGGDCGLISGAIYGNTGRINIIIINQYVAENHKSVYIRCEGTGATTTPFVDELWPGNGSVTYLQPPVVTVDGEGNWVIEIWAKIFPQPPGIEVYIELGTGQLTEAWAWECCTVGSIPSITEWGMVLLVGLMIISAGWIILRRRKKAIAGV